MRYWAILLFTFTFLGCQNENENVLEGLLNDNKSTFETVLNNPDKYEVQIIYTQIDRDTINTPTFTTYSYRADSFKYFYPAEAVKLPLAALALEKFFTLQKYHQKPVNEYSAVRIDSVRPPQTAVTADPTSATGLPNFAHYLQKAFVANDADAINRLYEFIGQQYIETTLTNRLFKQTKLVERIDAEQYTYEDNKYTNAMQFYKGDTILYEQEELYGRGGAYLPLQGTLKGSAFVKPDGVTVQQPFDFSKQNYMSLGDLQRVLWMTMFPEYNTSNFSFQLTEENYKTLYEKMSMPPRKSQSPVYDDPKYYDGYTKFLMYGDTKENIPDHIKVFNTSGKAYGYLTDCAYIIDTKNGVEFMLSAVIYTNENQTFNDGKYEYESIGLPFLGNLGRVVYAYELKRKRAIKPSFDWYVTK